MVGERGIRHAKACRLESLHVVAQPQPTSPMIIRALFILSLIATSAFALSEENVSQTLDGAPGGRLIVDVDFGTIDVAAGSDDKISVAVHRKIDSDNDSQEKEYFSST